jgi:hypothetical protein
MKLRISLAAIATAAAIGGTGAFLSSAASAKTATHHLAFTSVQQAQISFSGTSGGQDDKDVNKAGKVIGYDMLRFTFNPKANATGGQVTVMLNGGFLYGTLQLLDNGVTHGKVTGGTGNFKGATGTITGKNLDQAGTKTAVTIAYRT